MTDYVETARCGMDSRERTTQRRKLEATVAGLEVGTTRSSIDHYKTKDHGKDGYWKFIPNKYYSGGTRT